MQCQYSGCENQDTYPLIDDNNKKYHLCRTHYEQAKEKLSRQTSISEEELSDRIEALFGPEFRDASFDTYRSSPGDFEPVEDEIQPRLKSIDRELPAGESFSLRNHVGQLQAAKKGLEDFSEEMADTGRGTVVLGGNEGVGKTHLAAACVRRLIRAGYDPGVWHATEMLREIRATYNNNPSKEVDSVKSVIQKMLGPDVLVLEDIRESCFSTDMRDHIFDIVDQVYRNQSMLIITSNYRLSELKEPDRLSPELADRLVEPPSFIQDMTGVSFRQVRKAYQKKYE